MNFKMQCETSSIETRSVSPAQRPAVPDVRSEKTSDDVLLDAVALLSKTNSMSALQHGARLAVMGELLGSMLTHLPAAMRADIAGSFRGRIEDLMSLGDDRSLPGQYHSALLTEVNRYLNALR